MNFEMKNYLHKKEKFGTLFLLLSFSLYISLYEPLCKFSLHDLTRIKKRENNKTKEDAAFTKRNEGIDIRVAINNCWRYLTQI
jgi:hypothetical protein